MCVMKHNEQETGEKQDFDVDVDASQAPPSSAMALPGEKAVLLK